MKENMIQVRAKTMELQGTHYEIGVRLGKLIKEDHALKEKLIRFDTIMEDAKLANMVQWYRQWCPGLHEELQGIADALQIPYGALYFNQMTLLSPNCCQIAALSSITKEKKPLLARNYEFSKELEDFQLVKTIADGSYTHLGTSILLSGRDEGINEHGLAVTMTSCGMPIANLPHMRKASIEGLQYWVVVRAILENCRNVEEARTYINDMPIAFHMNMIVLDKDEHVALIQTYEGEKAIYPLHEEPRIYTTNHSVFDEHKQREPKVFRHSRIRYEYLEKELMRTSVISRDVLKAMLLADYPNGLCCHNYKESFGTTKSMILSPQDGTIELCWGGLEENHWNMYDIHKALNEEVRTIQLRLQDDGEGMFDWVDAS